MVQSSDHITGLTGATVTVTLSKAGGAFAAAGGTVTEISSGWYKIALTTTDTNTLGDLAFHCTATSGDPTDFSDQVTTQILGDTLTANTTQVSGVAQTGGDIIAAVSNIAVTGAALNAVAAGATYTTGTSTGGYTNTFTADGVYDSVADSAGTIDFYYQFSLGSTGQTAVGSDWLGYVVGVVNTIKVYAYNWGAAGWDQVATIVGISGTANMSVTLDLTSAHTGTGGNLGLVRIRFAATGLVSATVKTDRILVGYTVVTVFPTNFSTLSIDGSGRMDLGKVVGNVQTADANGLLKVDVEDFGGTGGTFSGGKPAVKLTSTDVTGNVASDLQTIKTQTVTCAAGVTVNAFVGNATHALSVDSSGNVTFNNTSIATVTTVTNQLTQAQIAACVWQDTTAGDFTVASSIGKSLYTSGVVPGGSGGLLISGTNIGTTTFGALTVTGATTFTGAWTATNGGNNVTGVAATVSGTVAANVTAINSISTGSVTTVNAVLGTATVGSTAAALATAQSGITTLLVGVNLNASQHVIVDSGTVTTVTNQLTAAQIATGVWQDATVGDFTTANSIGLSLYTGFAPGNTLGGLVKNNAVASLSALVVAGSTSLNTLSVSSTTTLTGVVTANNAGNSITGVTATVSGTVSANVVSINSISAGSVTTVDAVIGTPTVGATASALSTAQSGITTLLVGVNLNANQHVIVDSGTVTTVSGNVAGKVLGGGAGTITGVGAWVLDGSGAAVAPASTALSTAVWTAPPTGFLAVTFPSGTITNNTATPSWYTATPVVTLAAGALTDTAIAISGANRLADTNLRRSQANLELSVYGDSLALKSQYGFVQQAQQSDTTTTPGALTVYRTDGTTVLGTRTITTDPTAEPVTGVD